MLEIGSETAHAGQRVTDRRREGCLAGDGGELFCEPALEVVEHWPSCRLSDLDAPVERRAAYGLLKGVEPADPGDDLLGDARSLRGARRRTCAGCAPCRRPRGCRWSGRGSRSRHGRRRASSPGSRPGDPSGAAPSGRRRSGTRPPAAHRRSRAARLGRRSRAERSSGSSGRAVASSSMGEVYPGGGILRRVQDSDCPAFSGCQVRCGTRQSIPSSSMASCAGISATLPSFAEGQTNRPRSSRFESCHWSAMGPSDNGDADALAVPPDHPIRSPRRPRKTKR